MGGIPTTSKEQTKIVRRRPPRFDLIAGNVSLDFVNTLDDRHTKPKELLESYVDLARFGEDTGVLVRAGSRFTHGTQLDRSRSGKEVIALGERAARSDSRCLLGDHE